MGGRGSAGLGLGSCSLGSMVQDWAACVWRSWCCGAEDCEPAGVFRGVCVASCPSCVPGRIRPRWREVQGGLGAVDVTAAMSTCQEGGQRCPGKNLLPGMRGCWCRSTHRGGGGSRGGDALWGLRRRLLPPPPPPPRPGQRGSSASSGCSPSQAHWRWQESKEGAGFMACLVMCLWLGWDCRGCCPALPWATWQVPALHPGADGVEDHS